MSGDRGDDEELYLKPKTFRNRKSRPKIDVAEKSHPVHAPYRRDHSNLLLADDGDWDFMEDTVEDYHTDKPEA